MDAKKLGGFIAEMRKEKQMTQAELAKKLQVTDKAVSRWERGVGLPDIQTIEPLAEALGVSVIEVMKGERTEEASMEQQEVTEMLTGTLELAKEQRKKHLNHLFSSLAIGLAGLAVILFGIYLKVKEVISISVIGGADGLTSIFVAGKLSPDFYWGVMAVGALVVVLAVVLYWRRK